MLNRGALMAYRPKWPWFQMLGSSDCLKWSFRDLRNLDEALKLFKGRTLVVQAGGNLGIFPKRLAEEFKRVVTFEPDEGLFNRMKKNAPEKNVEAHRAALGDSTDPVAVATKRRDNSGRAVHEGLTHVSGPGVIPQVRIDDFNFPVCDLIYLDIEGYELHALKGAVETIRRCRPVIVVEINRNIKYYGTSPEELRQWIVDQGYSHAFSMNSDEAFVPNDKV